VRAFSPVRARIWPRLASRHTGARRLLPSPPRRQRSPSCPRKGDLALDLEQIRVDPRVQSRWARPHQIHRRCQNAGRDESRRFSRAAMGGEQHPKGPLEFLCRRPGPPENPNDRLQRRYERPLAHIRPASVPSRVLNEHPRIIRGKTCGFRGELGLTGSTPVGVGVRPLIPCETSLRRYLGKLANASRILVSPSTGMRGGGQS
jgi:hypothetical protein